MIDPDPEAIFTRLLKLVFSTVRQSREHGKAATQRLARDRSYRPSVGRALRSCVEPRADLISVAAACLVRQCSATPFRILLV